MKKVIIASLFFLVILTMPLCISAVEYEKQVPDKSQQYVSLSGGYMLYELSDRNFYLLDTRTGRLWKLIGDLQQSPQIVQRFADGQDASVSTLQQSPQFVPVKYENSKGALIVQPEYEGSKQFPGRFAFAEMLLKLSSNAFIMLDTLSGNMWKLQGTPDEPLKLTLVPRKD
jgi:hypothetical protein